MNRLIRLVISLATPVLALVVVWAAGQLVQRFAPEALTALLVVGLLLWAGSIHVVGRGLHRALWYRDQAPRDSEAGPWGKLLLTALFTVLWFGLLAQLLALAFPAYFRRP